MSAVTTALGACPKTGAWPGLDGRIAQRRAGGGGGGRAEQVLYRAACTEGDLKMERILKLGWVGLEVGGQDGMLSRVAEVGRIWRWAESF